MLLIAFQVRMHHFAWLAKRFTFVSPRNRKPFSWFFLILLLNNQHVLGPQLRSGSYSPAECGSQYRHHSKAHSSIWIRVGRLAYLM